MISPKPSRGTLAAQDAEGPQETTGPKEARQVPQRPPQPRPSHTPVVPTDGEQEGQQVPSLAPYPEQATSLSVRLPHEGTPTP